jgi:hypothetical protein
MIMMEKSYFEVFWKHHSTTFATSNLDNGKGSLKGASGYATQHCTTFVAGSYLLKIEGHKEPAYNHI